MTARDPESFLRPELRALSLYHLDQASYRFKLDQNEVPWDLPRRIKLRVLDRLARARWSEYPDFHADALRAALGRLHGWPAEGVLAGNGSSELLGIALDGLVFPRGEILSVTPSFGLYGMLMLRGSLKGRFLGPSDDLRLPLEAIRDEVARDPTRPVLLCSPNNPVGDAATVEEIEALLEALEAPLLLDNAYGEFCRFDYRPLLVRHRHLILLRTLSKAWSLAGMRLGYLLADPAVVEQLIKIKLPYNLNHASFLAAMAMLEEPAASARAVRVLVERREQWHEMLAARGLEVFPSEANFVLVRCGRGADAQERMARVRDGLAERGILVRDVSGYPGMAGCLRISVGTGAALRAVSRALEEI